jgi:hypothetical protein
VAGGHEGNFDDPMQGLVMIFHGPRFHTFDPTTEIYRTPQRVGPVRLVSVDGMRFTLVSVPGYPGRPQPPQPTFTPLPQVTFVFDLATRQWVSPPTTPGPSPSALVSPVPSVSPLPTQAP